MASLDSKTEEGKRQEAFDDYDYDPERVRHYVENRQDRRLEWQDIAAKSQAEQIAYVNAAPTPIERDIRKRGIYDAQYRNWVEGGTGGEGFIPPTDSTSLTRRQLALGEQTEALTKAVTDDPANYTYQAQLEQDVGYRPQDKFRYLDENPQGYETGSEAAVNQHRTDRTGVGAQKQVLGEYDKLYSQGGLSALDRARFAQAQQMREQEARGQREATMGRAEQMGRAGGNASLVSQLLANQGSTNRLANDQLQYEALALGRKDALLGAKADLGGQMQTSTDAIDQFNALGERGRQERMADRTTSANKDRFDESNSRAANNQSQYNQGVNTGFGYDIQREAGNTDRINDQNRLNVSADYGARGQLKDQLAAKAFAAGNTEAAAALFGQKESAHEQAQATKDAARYNMYGQLASSGIQAASNVASKPKVK